MPTIDSFYQQLIADLTGEGRIQDVSRKLFMLNTNEDRVDYVREIINKYNSYPIPLRVVKSDSLSSHYRELGNSEFKKCNEYKAWQYYNLSLLNAPLHSDNFILAYANRSAVFYSIKKYDECLKDIEKVFSLKYPEKLHDKLTKRQGLCRAALVGKTTTVSDAWNHNIASILSASTAKDPQYICASSMIEVVSSSEMGRHVIAKEDIKVGDVLAVEEPYFNLLLKPQFVFNCSYCLSRDGNLDPCDTCCFSLYCSQQCKEKAKSEYHAIECSLIPTLIDMDFTKLELLALRTVIKARNDYSDWKCLLDVIYQADATIGTEHHGLVNVNGNWIYNSKYYSSIHTLSSNVLRRTVSDIFQKSVTAAMFLHFLAQYTAFFSDVAEEERVNMHKVVGGLLLHHIMTSPTNMHSISSNIQSADGNFLGEVNIGSAPYAFLSLLNHSCAPNVVRFHKLGSGRMTLVAIRRINKGMQLFDNYGCHHALQQRQSRQDSLKFQYKFICCCEACIYDWPTYIQLRSGLDIPQKILDRKAQVMNEDTIEGLQKGKLDVALQNYKPLCELATALEDFAPCSELADCQEAMKQCLAIFHGTVPYGYSDIVEWGVVETPI